MKLIYLTALVVVAAACNKATFGSDTGKRTNSAVLPNSRLNNPQAEPLDVSTFEQNKKAFPAGPQGGGGAVLDKTIELTCDNSAGVIIDAGGDIPTPPDVTVPGTEPVGKPFLRLLGKDTAIDTDGKPIGKGSDGGSSSGSGSEPLPTFPPIPVPPPMKAVAASKANSVRLRTTS